MKNYRFIWALVCIAAAFLSAGQAAWAYPSNDHCSNPSPIGNVTNQSFSTQGADHDGGPAAYCYGNNIWYLYTATCTGTAKVSTCGTIWDSMVAVYDGSGCPTASNRIAHNDDDPNCGWASTASFPVVCGNQYLIEVGHYDFNVYGSGVITITCTGTPCSQNNDNCANATAIGNVVDLAFNTTNATFDGPDGCNTHHSPNIWYLYTPTCTGQAYISLCGSSFDTLLSVYSGTSCNSLTQVGCNDDGSCGHQSDLTINVTAGKNYWIAISGFNSTDKGQGKLNISCNGQVQQASDLGDAPDSTNHKGVSMKTYDTQITANYPTVFQGNAIHGPIHLQPKAVAYLGSTVTYEDEADQGYDQDPTNNIIPLQSSNNANRDLGDDGVIVPLTFNHCKLNCFEFDVTVVEPNVDMWINVWIDWNRDGDWNDDGNTDQNLNCNSCSDGTGVVNEWAVQNQLLYNLHTGVNHCVTPGFLAWNPSWGDQKVWMRITLSEQPWKGGSNNIGGSGPASGYEYGETEDYYFTPNETCAACEDINRDGVIDLNDLIDYMMNWLTYCQNN